MKYYLGIDLGGTNIAAGIVDETEHVIAEEEIPTGASRGAEAVVEDMANVARMAAGKAGLTLEDVEWVGVGCPGSANKALGEIEYANNLNWHNVPLVRMLSERTGRRVYIENDANAAAYGEYRAGAGAKADILVMVTLGTGVGGGIIVHNTIYTGFNFAGAELGHEVMVLDGRPCTCGRRGCVEAYASATGLITTTREFMERDKASGMWELCGGDLSKVNGRTAFDAMRAGDSAGKAAAERYIRHLACAVTNYINVFQPDMLCIGGGISREGETLLAPLREQVLREVYTRHGRQNTEIVAASLGNTAGIIGAALLGSAQ